MFQPRPPIFVSDKGDLTVHRSVESALRYVEPWDVSESLVAFDADGHRLRIRAEGVKRTRFSVGGGETVLDEAQSGQPDAAGLKALLRDYITRVGAEELGVDSEWMAAADLPDLVTAVIKYWEPNVI